MSTYSKRPSRTSTSEGGKDRSLKKKEDFLGALESIKGHAKRTEDLTKGVITQYFQNTIHIREVLKEEFTNLEKLAQDENSLVRLKDGIISMSGKIMTEVSSQEALETKIAEAYSKMKDETCKWSKELLDDTDNSKTISPQEKQEIATDIGNVMNIINEFADHWITRPGVTRRKSIEMKRDDPKVGMDAEQMFNKLDKQLKQFPRTENPLTGVTTVSREFARLSLMKNKRGSKD
uniref:Pyruvate kinase n=1 Tax=Lygus hesperus TaxID=30085 RepID=A0A0A9ZC71_LYGHE